MDIKKLLKQHFHGKKAVSSVITTIILTSILLVILVVASFVSLGILSLQVMNTEFEQAKSNMILLEDLIEDVSLRSGSGGYVQFNEQNGGIGIAKTTQTVTITASPDQTFITVKPGAAGFYSQWTVFPPSTDRVVASSDGADDTYLSAASINKKETQVLSNVTPRPSPINSVTVNTRISATAPKNEAKNLLRITNQDFAGLPDRVQNNFGILSYTWIKNPATNQPWQWSELANLEIGCEVTKYSGGEIRVSELSADVDFTPSSQTTHLMSGSHDLFELQYRAGSQVSAAATVMSGTSNCVVGTTEGLGYLRVEQDQGSKILLNYNRVRVANQTLVDTNTNMVQVTFIDLVKGNWGGAGSVNLKVQNIKVESVPHVIPSSSVTLSIQFGQSQASMFFNKYAGNPDVLSTVVIFTKMTIQASTA